MISFCLNKSLSFFQLLDKQYMATFTLYVDRKYYSKNGKCILYYIIYTHTHITHSVLTNYSMFVGVAYLLFGPIKHFSN